MKESEELIWHKHREKCYKMLYNYILNKYPLADEDNYSFI